MPDSMATTDRATLEGACPVRVRGHGPPARPTLIYLPGLHGSWALSGGFRRAISYHVRFVEVTYPPTLEWSLADYAAAVEASLATLDIRGGWLLGESFGSQVVWQLVARQKLAVEGVVLAGGFGRHPAGWEARLAAWTLARVPLAAVHSALSVYAIAAKLRFRKHPGTVDEIWEFIGRFDEAERRAAVHRLRLVCENNPDELARQAQVRVFGISGLWDPVVPWAGARAWLRQNCPTLSGYRIVWHADHNVLGTAPDTTARLVRQWMTEL
jgi:pimeloyl-ACP methyl ester carboxylesterase